MNKSDIAKIKARLRPDGYNPIEIRGWYVNSKKAIISEISKSLISLGQTESEKYTQIFKRVLSGEIGKTLSIVKFSLSEVMEGKMHERLMQLSGDAFYDEILMQDFVREIVDRCALEGNNLILFMHDVYDTDYYSGKEDQTYDQKNPSHVFQYMICAVCPVKLAKPTLSYSANDNDFVTKEPDWIVSAPEIGFMFPCFEDMGANISAALFYSKDLGRDHNDFIGAALTEKPLTPVKESKEAFKSVLMESLQDECSLNVVESLNEQLIDKLEEQKKDKLSEPRRIGAKELGDALRDSGVSDDRADLFVEHFENEFGSGNDLPLAGITDDKSFELKTADVMVKVSPRKASQIETRVIDGIKYILIPADDGVIVNGINIGF